MNMTLYSRYIMSILLIAAAFLFISPMFAHASEMLDQEYTELDDGYSFTIFAGRTVAQGFTAGLDGDLTRVEVRISHPSCTPTEDLELRIVPVDEDLNPVPETVLASQLFSPEEVSATEGDWLSFSFDPISSEVGSMFAIVASSTAIRTGCYYEWFGNDPRSDNPVYDGGLSYVGNFDGRKAIKKSPADLDFRTYVGSDPGATNPGTDVEVVPEAVDPDGNPTGTSPVTFNFDEVTEGGDTTVTVSGIGNIPPAGLWLGIPPMFFELDTTATFVGNVEICIDYSGMTFFNENNLKLIHYGDGGWENITTSLDTDNDIICGETDSFSEFTVAEERTPLELLGSLEDEVEALSVGKLSMILLGGRLKIAEHLLTDNNGRNDRAVPPILESFIRGVERHEKFGIISSEEAASLIGHAQEILELLN